MDRASNALRRWLAAQGVLMPSEERLNAWWLDMERLKDLDDQRLSWAHDGKLLRLWRQHLTIVDSDLEGQWVFEVINDPTVGYGLSNADYERALADGLIQECARSGGEKLRVAPKTPRKILKNLFQEMAVPPWQRTAPLLMLGSEVLAVAGVGMNLDLCVEMGTRWVANWEPIEKNSN